MKTLKPNKDKIEKVLLEHGTKGLSDYGAELFESVAKRAVIGFCTLIVIIIGVLIFNSI